MPVQQEMLPVPGRDRNGGAEAVMDAYWRFAADRHAMWMHRVGGGAGAAPPDDPILRTFRFTNAYRICDRVSQYLVREVQYRYDQSPLEVVLRTLLFKLFNKIETWELICSVGVPTASMFDPAAVSELLGEAQRNGQAVYSAAYIVPPVALCPSPKHRGHLELIARMLDDGLPELAGRADGLAGLYRLLRGYPGIGPFLAYQLAIDLNYSSAVDFDEAEFVVAGPGALDGISKCLPGTAPSRAERIIHEVCDRQEEEFAERGIPFPGLLGRRLQPVDCQNLFCEISKYSRVAFPGVAGSSGRTRIKQRYAPAGPLPPPFFPPKWGLASPVVAATGLGAGSTAPTAAHSFDPTAGAARRADRPGAVALF